MKREKLNGIMRCMLCFVLTVAGMLIVLGAFSIIVYLSRNEFLMKLFNGEQKEPILGAFAKLILTILQYAAFIIIPILLATKAWKYKIADMGLTPIKKDWKDFVIGLIAGAAGISIAFLCLILSGSIQLTGWSFTYLNCVMIELVCYIIVGFGEEIFFRGALMLSLKRVGNKRLIVILTSAVFAAMHLGNYGITVLAFANLFLFGLFAAFCFIRSKNIWLPIGFHITWNFVQGNVYGFHVSGNTDYSLVSQKVLKETAFTGGAFGPEGGIGVTIALILCFVFAVWYYRKQPETDF